MTSRSIVAKLNRFSNPLARDKAIEIYKVLGRAPSSFCFGKDDKLERVTFRDIEGLDVVTISNRVYKKLHPYKAPVFVTAGKYLKVPDYLLGPLKYASETINIEQLEIDDKTNSHYQETGEKLHALVTGSCASITISAITVKFVEDMCRKYSTYAKFERVPFAELNRKFRAEYDRRVGAFLCGRGIRPRIPWFKNKLEKNEGDGPWNRSTRKKMGCHKGKRGFSGTRKANKHGL